MEKAYWNKQENVLANRHGKIVAGDAQVKVLDGIARYERRRAAVHVYLGDEYVLCEPRLAMKFDEGKRYRAYVVDATWHLLSMEPMDS